MSRRLQSSLRPFVCKECRTRVAAAPIQSRRATSSHPPQAPNQLRALDNVDGVEKRIEELGGRQNIHKYFPRCASDPNIRTLSAANFSQKFGKGCGEENEMSQITIYGRVTSRRTLGSKLLLLDLSTGADRWTVAAPTHVQLNMQTMQQQHSDLASDALKVFRRKVKHGDWLAVTGRLGKDKEGNLRLEATSLPKFLAPSLQVVPTSLTDPEVRMRNRHADQIVNPSARDIIYLRSKLISGIRRFLMRQDFIEVNTPILSAGAGGAVARPFQTSATEFPDTKLNLRVAPELFLKRMIVGGMPKVFEIGSAFRNEGVDATHNPEFTTCEFYSVMTTLEDLMNMTQKLFISLAHIAQESREYLPSVPEPVDTLTREFLRLEFIPAIEEAINKTDLSWKFPDLTQPNALNILIDTLNSFSILLPSDPTLPRLLDTLAAHFLEPQCTTPTFITHHPSCMSPLAKSFLRLPTHPSGTSHLISARAELFIHGREYVNCYEEENSPIEQRRKFEEQIKYRVGGVAETHGSVDESYVKVLEWGMPPTGGWGCGVDRIVMLFGGKGRIADVLPFGTLRNVVGLGTAARREAGQESGAGIQVGEGELIKKRVDQSIKVQWPVGRLRKVEETLRATGRPESNAQASRGVGKAAFAPPSPSAPQPTTPRLMSFKDLR